MASTKRRWITNKVINSDDNKAKATVLKAKAKECQHMSKADAKVTS